MSKQIIALFILAICSGSNSVPIVSFDPFDHPSDIDIIGKQPDVICPLEESVNLSGLSLKQIPKEVVRSKTIKSINLDNNDIVELPIDAFNATPNLNCLNLARNKLSSELMNLKHNDLKTLILDHQNYGRENWSFYEKLNLHVNLETLSWKGFGNNSIFLVLFLSVRNVYLSDSNLTSIYDSIGWMMPTLKSLHLERNRITSIYEVNFGNVEALYLDGNPLVKILNPNPTHVKNITILSLSNCSLTGLTINSFPSLKVLDLSYNSIPFTKSERLETSPLLKVLDLSHSNLRRLPYLDNFVRLEQLSLSYNLFENVSKALGPSSLITLNLHRIVSIESVAFLNLAMLRDLDLSENKLQYLPSDWNAGLRSLRNLNLKSNRFLKLEHMAVHSLTNLEGLYIKGNLFSYVDTSTLVNHAPQNCIVYVA